MTRIAVGGFLHETNTFAPMPTGLASFRDRGYFPAGQHPDPEDQGRRDDDRRGVGRAAGIELDRGAFEQADLEQAILVVEQEALAVDVAAKESRHAAHGGFVEAAHAFDPDVAQAITRPVFMPPPAGA